MAADPFFSNVSLLLRGDGTNGSTTFTDETGKAVTAVGDAQISTAQSKFGGSSINVRGAGFVTTTNSSDFDFSGAADFTLEAWINGTVYDTYRGILCSRQDASSSGWGIFVAASGKLSTFSTFTGTGSSGELILHNTPIVAGVWTHVALVKQAAGYTAYVNGVAGALLTFTGGLEYLPSQPLAVGTLGSQGQLPFYGYIDEVRITKGVARYTASFTPPTAAFLGGPQISGTVLGIAGTPVARIVRAYRRSDGALLASTISNAATGAYAMNVPSGEVSVVTFDNADTGTLYNDRIIRVIPI